VRHGDIRRGLVPPPFVQEPSQQGAKVAVPIPGASVEPDTAVAEVAPASPALPTRAIFVSSEDEAEAAPCVALPTVSNLLRAIPDTPKVAPNMGRGMPRGPTPRMSYGRYPSGCYAATR
jgi:hypothetical protein